MSNFKRINDFKFWCQKVLPLVYDDSLSYYEVLCKMSEYLNGVIDNVNELPEMVNEAVQNWISSGDLQNALNALLQGYNPINVKNPPQGLPAAKGDGETDDTYALQYLADYADDNNLPLFFPSGVYRASSLQIHGITMFGYNATIFKTPNTENSLINITETAALYGFELNGNIDGQNNPASVVYVSDCKNAIISNCAIKNGTICVDAHIGNVLTLNECSFGNFTDYAVQVQGTGCLMANNLIVESVANSGALAYVNLTTFNGFISNFFSLAHIPLGFDVTGNMNKIEASIPNADNPVDDKGNFNYIYINGKIVKHSAQRIFENFNTKQVEGDSETISVTTHSLKAENSTEDITMNKVINANTYTANVEEDFNVNSKEFNLSPENPLTYSHTPTAINNRISGVPAKTPTGSQYNILVTNRTSFDPYVLAFGDSLLDGGGWLNGLAKVFPMGKTFNYGKGGAGYIRKSDDGSTFITMVDKAVAEISAKDKNDMDLVLIGGSLNDWIIGDTKEQLQAAVDQVLERVHLNFPNAKIVGFMPCGSMARTVKSFFNTQYVKDRFLVNGFAWADWIEYVLYNQSSLVQADEVHPLPAGYDKIGQWLNAWLNHGETFNVTETYQIITGGNGFITGRLSGGMVSINMNYITNTNVKQPTVVANLKQSYLPSFPQNILAPLLNGGGEPYNNMLLFLSRYAIQIGGNVNLGNNSTVYCNFAFPAAASNDID